MDAMSVTRSDFLCGALGTALLAAAGRVEAAPAAVDTLQDFWNRLPALLDQHPDWPGVAQLNDWVGAAPAGLTPEQESLLRGTLVLQAEQLLRLGGGAIQVGLVEDALGRGLAVDVPSKAYFGTLLEHVERRVAEDGEFATRVADAVKRAEQLDAASAAITRRRLSFPEIGAIVVAVAIIVILILL